MTVVEIIDEVRHLSPEEQDELADEKDPARTAVIKKEIAEGFYGSRA